MNISQMINQGYILEVLQAELDKCEVRCMNCHMREEEERYDLSRLAYSHCLMLPDIV